MSLSEVFLAPRRRKVWAFVLKCILHSTTSRSCVRLRAHSLRLRMMTILMYEQCVALVRSRGQMASSSPTVLPVSDRVCSSEAIICNNCVTLTLTNRPRGDSQVNIGRPWWRGHTQSNSVCAARRNSIWRRLLCCVVSVATRKSFQYKVASLADR